MWNVPIELFTKDGLNYTPSVVGCPLYMDKAKEQQQRIKFARVCVEIGSKDDQPDSIMVDIEGVGAIAVRVEHPWKPQACSTCGKFG